MQVNVHTAKTTLSDLIARAEGGEEIIIARNGKPSVKLVPVEAKEPRRFGVLKGIIGDCDIDWFEPMDDAELRLWEGGGDEGLDDEGAGEGTSSKG